MPSIRRLLPILWQKSGGICALCLWALDPKNLHIDHIVPKSRGGTNDIDNLQVVHRLCNIRKCDSPMEEAIIRIRTTPVGHHERHPFVNCILTDELMQRIDDYWFAKRLPTRTASVRQLIREGLEIVGR